jgi:hypothetical protein
MHKLFVEQSLAWRKGYKIGWISYELLVITGTLDPLICFFLWNDIANALDPLICIFSKLCIENGAVGILLKKNGWKWIFVFPSRVGNSRSIPFANPRMVGLISTEILFSFFWSFYTYYFSWFLNVYLLSQLGFNG